MPIKLLSHTHPSATDFYCMPKEYYDFVNQFIYTQGSWESQLDIDSLMLLLWQMHQRIIELEARQ